MAKAETDQADGAAMVSRWVEPVRDLMILAGLGLFSAGATAQWGWPIASMSSGAVLLGIGILSAWRA